MTNENNEFVPETKEEVLESIEETVNAEDSADNIEKDHGKEEKETIDIISEKKEKKEKSSFREMIEWVLCIGIAVILAFFIRDHVFTLVRVDGESMFPTLCDEDRLVVTRLGYEPQRGDIIVFNHTVKMIGENKVEKEKQVAYVKRVIGVEGDTVEIDYTNNQIYVNGEVIKEDYIDRPMEYRGPDEAVTVPKDSVFVLGDNRNNSKDSRDPSVGFVPEETIIGKASMRIWPLNSFGTVEVGGKGGTTNWIFYLVIAILLILLIYKIYFKSVKVSDDSMNPSLKKKDRVIVKKFRYQPGIGDVIAFRTAQIKVDENGKKKKKKSIRVMRIIGAKGDTLCTKENTKEIYVNGSPLREDYINQSMNAISFEEMTVPEGFVFVLGDNRNNIDGEHKGMGFVSEEAIIGKVSLRVWPIGSFGVMK